MTAIDCESRIERVVLYARGAVVSRRITLPAELPAEPFELRVPGVTAIAETGSLRAFIEGDREIVALRSQLVVPEGAARPGRLLEAARVLGFRRDRLEAERAQLAFVRAAIAGASLDPRLSRWASRPRPGERFGDAIALADLLAAEIERLDRRQQELTDAIEETRLALAVSEIEAAQGSTAEIAGKRRPHLDLFVRLGAAPGELRALRIEYAVGAARWWPAYTARFSAAATKVAFTIEAFVAQASGEDWTGVALSVSTADLAQDARLPTLRSLRLGRAQPALRKGYRPAPIGLDAMFEGYDRSIAGASTTRSGRSEPRPVDIDALLSSTIEQERVVFSPPAQHSFGGAPPSSGAYQQQSSSRTQAGTMMPMSASMPAPAMAMPQPSRLAMPKPAAPRVATRQRAEVTAESAASFDLGAAHGGGGAAGAPEEADASDIEPGEAFLDFDALTLPDPSGAADPARRGRLAPGDRSGGRALASVARAAIDALQGPPETRDPLETRGRFDHRYDAEGHADVPSNGQLHRVAITGTDATSKPRFVTVPREVAEVYREAAIKNPFASPLLSGPVEVFFDGALLTTTGLRFVDRQGTMHLGLGVEDRLRVARNVRVDEGTAGLLGGSTTMDHNVTIEIASSLGQKVTVEVLDRVPVSDEKDIDIKVLHQRPESSPYAQAERGEPIRRGLRWTIEVPAGEKRKIELAYRLTLPGKNEVIGGNRRE